MATYAIGDLQGCAEDFEALLQTIGFDARSDRLWLTGDLVNRGPASLDTLRLVVGLGDSAVTVLGNHDLHLLAAALGVRKIAASDTISDILQAPDRDALLTWVRTRPLAIEETIGDEQFLLVHAGVLPQWSMAKTLALAHEVEAELRSSRWATLVAGMYGNQPDHWDDNLQGLDRWRVIINVLTRLRFCTAAGVLDLKSKEGAGGGPPGFHAWFDLPERKTADITVINGHWSTLGLRLTEHNLSIDTGCVWGGHLTAVRLEDRSVFSVSCDTHLQPGVAA
jgi:bis(5'-nucleosyl)-tetraphosphatase (symmetrical)